MRVYRDKAYRPSADIVARVIQGKLIIVPLTAGVGEAADDLYTLNETGKKIWELMDGSLTVRDIAGRLASVYDAPMEEIQGDVDELVEDLLSRGILV